MSQYTGLHFRILRRPVAEMRSVRHARGGNAVIRLWCRDPRRPPDWGDYTIWIVFAVGLILGLAWILRELMLHIADRYGRG